MNIQFYNTLSNSMEPFEPLNAPKVTMYSCGPTVYDYAHIGNFRSFLFADLLRRFLEAVGYEVRHVMNITDVGHMTEDQVADGGGEDKMASAARRLKESKKQGTDHATAIENPDDPFQVAEFYMDAFLEDARTLGLKVAFEESENIFRATDHIPAMQAMITKLLERGHAYQCVDGTVYYSVESFPSYGKLSGNTLDQIRSGAGGRVEAEDQASKRHPADFLLWKPDESHLMKWDSPWGTGYPGWHIECSAMASLVLGDVIDLHTGGEDLIFPHHECEIAQSCGVTGESHFARFWLHARFLMVEGEKMSKSKGNFFTVRDVLQGKATGRDVHPAVLRYELIKSHYRANMNFTKKGLSDSAAVVRKLREFTASMQQKSGGEAAPIDQTHPIWGEFLNALSDDLNISKAMGGIMTWLASSPTDASEALAVCQKLDTILGFSLEEPTQPLEEAEAGGEAEQAESLCKQIDEARQAKDYASADAARQKLIELGYEVSTTKEGTSCKKQLV
ncbi:Cysteine--tRNA ligase [Planctomycetales bacterium 10988]|nr:Cysteine--tRNA ligase [Planctomycetales bacterium 10988]